MQNKKTTILLLLATSFFIVGYYPALELLARKWSTSDDYAHSFLIVPIIAYMIWDKRNLFTYCENKGYIGLSLVVLSVVSYIISLQTQIPTVIFLATALTLTSVLIYMGGPHVLRELIIPIVLIFMIIPIPNQMYSMITLPLQLKVSQVNEVLVHLLGVPIYREGNILQIPGKSFEVVEACSGMRSLISLTTLSLVFGYFTLQKSRLKCVLFCLSIPIAFVINVLRVFILVLAFHFLKLDLTVGIEHTTLGMILFLSGLGLLFAAQRMLEFWEN